MLSKFKCGKATSMSYKWNLRRLQPRIKSGLQYRKPKNIHKESHWKQRNTKILEYTVGMYLYDELWITILQRIFLTRIEQHMLCNDRLKISSHSPEQGLDRIQLLKRQGHGCLLEAWYDFWAPFNSKKKAPTAKCYHYIFYKHDRFSYEPGKNIKNVPLKDLQDPSQLQSISKRTASSFEL